MGAIASQCLSMPLNLQINSSFAIIWAVPNYPQNINRTDFPPLAESLLGTTLEGWRLERLKDRNGWIRWPVSRVLCRLRSHGDAAAIPLDRLSPDGSRDRPGRLGRRGLPALRPTRRPYSVLLQAGLAMPSRSPGPRWALTPPFHPYPSSPCGFGRRFAFCGAIPGVAPGGRYPPPFRRGARTFLPHAVTSMRATARPSDPRVLVDADRRHVKAAPFQSA